MKNLLLITFIFCGITASAQLITPINPTTPGLHVKVLKPDSALLVPDKPNLTRNVGDTQSQVFVNTSDTSLWFWTRKGGFRKVGTGVNNFLTSYTLYPLRAKDSSNGKAYQYLSPSWIDSNAQHITSAYPVSNGIVMVKENGTETPLALTATDQTAIYQINDISNISKSFVRHDGASYRVNIHGSIGSAITPHDLGLTANGINAGVGLIDVGDTALAIDISSIPQVKQPPTTIQYAAGDSLQIVDNGGLNYDGSNLSVGHNNANVASGFFINGSRASIQAYLYGMFFNVGSGYTIGTYDGTKQYTFQNRGNTYFHLYSTGSGPWVHYADFTTNVRIGTLATVTTAPTSNGTTKMVVTDQDGLLSYTNMSAISGNQAMVGTGTLNTSSVSASPVMNFIQFSSHVSAQISLGLTPTSTGPVEFTFTLPVATTAISGTYVGTGVVAENAGTAIAPAMVYVLNSTTIKVRYVATIASTGTCSVNIIYPK